MKEKMKTRRFVTRQKLMVAALSACFAAGANALPTDPAVVGGAATFAQAGNTLTVTNSNGAMINWQSFNIGAGETTRFIQPSASSAVLNTVLANNPSALHGTLSSNGQVWLINTAGILVGPGAVIDTARFVASTLNVRAEDFLAGRLNFQNTPGAGDVINQGTITTPLGGSVYLVGTNVTNEGVITTPSGETILAAGATVSLIDTGAPGVKVDITGEANNATNLGTIVAEAGRIGIAGTIVKNSGTLDASGVVSEGGRIFLKASQDTYVDGNGRIVATGTKGGQVEVLGNRVAVMDNASIDVSGSRGGGTIKVGGDFQGKNAAIQNASITYFGSNATLKANATEVGDGGTVIVWADDLTRAYGHIEARGGPGGGNGGFVETSGKQHLDFAASVDTRAPQGAAGTLLLDPTDITIVASATPYGGFGGTPFFVDPSSFDSTDTIGWDLINGALSSGNVIIQTSSSGSGTGNIQIDAGGVLAGSGYSLSLLAENGITLANNVDVHHSGTGNLTLVSGWDSASGYTTPTATHASNTGDMTFNSGSSISTNDLGSGNVTLKAKGQIRLTDAYVGAGGGVNIEAQSLLIEAVTGGAGIFSKGDQSITLGTGVANADLTLTSTIGYAQISTYGSQFITFNGSAANTLYLQGSNSNTTYGGNSAEIRADGNQSIAYNSGSLAITLAGGSGVPSVLNDSWDDYGLPTAQLICTSCAAHNSAQIEADGNQTIHATSITITGGSNGNENWAGIEADGNANYVVSGNISITGGSSGGAYVTNQTTGLLDSLSNDAGIEAEGYLTVSAGSITLNGGAATVGGAYIVGGTGVSVATTGNVSLTGGSSPSPYWEEPAAPAIIGSEVGSVSLNVGGTLNVSGGTGSTALIGTFDASAPVSITANSGITLSSGAGAAPVGIGFYKYNNWGYYAADGDIGISPEASLFSNGNITLYAAGSIRGMYGSLSTPGTVNLYAGWDNIGAYFIDVYGNVSANTINASSTDWIHAYTLTANAINLTSANYIYAQTVSSGSISATLDGSGTYADIGIANIGTPTSVNLVNNNSAATDSWMWFGNIGDLTLGSGSQFTSANGGSLGIWSSGLLTLNNLSLQRDASPAGYGEIWLEGYTGINLSGTTVRTTATGAMTNEAYSWVDEYGNTVTEEFSYNMNGISLWSAGDIALTQGTHIEAPNADVMFELYGADSTLYVGKSGDVSPSYVLSKGTTTYLNFPYSSAANIFIDGVATTTTAVGGSGFFAGSLSTPATQGAGLVITTASSQSEVVGGIIQEINDAADEPVVLGDSTLPITPTDGEQIAAEESTGGGEDEFGEGEEEEQNGDKPAGEGKDKEKGKKKAAQCKG